MVGGTHKMLVCTVGLPRSGKSTWAMLASKQHGWPIVNPDSVRLAIHGQRFVAEAEGFVWATVQAMVKALLLAGHDTVILDATNGTRKRRDEWKSQEWITIYRLVDTSKDICVARAIETDRLDLIPVIERMASQWEPLGEDENRLI